jgi:hypothetical protein
VGKVRRTLLPDQECDHYAAGIHGRYGPAVPYNIETLVNTLYELERNEEHPIYPFVAAWNSRLIALAGKNFELVREFRERILDALKGWVQMESTDSANYYAGLRKLQRGLQFPLRIFSLNYDLCVEGLSQEGFRIEAGFSGVGESHRWEWKRFDESDPQIELPEIYLYKMHGSINWKRDSTGNLICVNYAGANIRADEMQVIFGRDFKLEAADPYLFYAFEFRRSTLESRVIICIGYGFGDEHINKMIAQAIRHDGGKRVAVVARVNSKEEVCSRESAITKKLRVPHGTVVVVPGTAKEFLERGDLVEFVNSLVPKEETAEF